MDNGQLTIDNGSVATLNPPLPCPLVSPAAKKGEAFGFVRFRFIHNLSLKCFAPTDPAPHWISPPSAGDFCFRVGFGILGLRVGWVRFR